jgi:hypothetical protein
MEKDIAELKRQVEMLTRKLDETRRVCGLSPIIDEQLMAINARANDRRPAA